MTKVAELDFTDKALNERWSRVKDDFWGDVKVQTILGIKRLLETRMDVEMQDVIGARRWKRVPRRRIYRNGSYYRGLMTSFGWMGNLTIPRIRNGVMRFKCLPNYQRRTGDVDKLVLEMFLAGVSTRRVKEVLEPLMGKQALSSSTVSKISKVLDQQVSCFHHRQITDDFEYLILDGIYLKAKSPVHSRRRCILVVYGIRKNGTREMIDYRLARNGESQAAWECFLTSLNNRGLKGNFLKLAVVDGNRGLWNALNMIWPDVPRQRCWAHKLRNVANHIPKRLQKACTNQAREIYNADSRREAIKAFKWWSRVWRPISPEAVDCLERDLEDLLQFYECPKPMWIKVRTTNIIERIFREVRRRTRPMSCFTNVQSVERIIYAIFYRQNKIWRDKPLKEITQNS
jgi:putative transposase